MHSSKMLLRTGSANPAPSMMPKRSNLLTAEDSKGQPCQLTTVSRPRPSHIFITRRRPSLLTSLHTPASYKVTSHVEGHKHPTTSPAGAASRAKRSISRVDAFLKMNSSLQSTSRSPHFSGRGSLFYGLAGKPKIQQLLQEAPRHQLRKERLSRK